MPLYFYRPIYWRRGGHVVCLNDASELSARECAQLFALSWATLMPTIFPTIGDFMSDDLSQALRLVSAPASEPISLASAKLFLRIEHTADDETITRGITAARQAAEHYLRTALISQTWDYAIANPPYGRIDLPFGPAQSIASISATNEAGTSTTVASGNYRLSVDGRSVLFDPAVSTEKLTIRFVAGIATTASEVPSAIVQGMLHHLAAMMEQRGGVAPMPSQSLVCYQPYRQVSL